METKEEPVAVEAEKKGGSKVVRNIVILVVVIVLAIGGLLLWRYMDTYESTDDAQVDARLNPVSARIAGVVTAVHFDNNKAVNAGDPLVELDPGDYKVLVDEAKANVALAASQVNAETPNVPITQTSNNANVEGVEAQITGAEAGVATATRDHEAAVAELHEAEANAARAQTEEARYRVLVEKEEVARVQYDQKLADSRALAAAVDSKRAKVSAADKAIAERRAVVQQMKVRLTEAQQNNPRQVTLRQAGVQIRNASLALAQTRLAEAQLNMSYANIVAPVAGIVGKKSVEVGQHVQPGEQLLVITQAGDIWITANFKETQLKRIRPGQRVTIGIDAFDKSFEGYIDSVAGATGARYSVLPPENATGNYVKVVQRVPVRIRINKDQAGVDLLRPGMSVEPKVWMK